MRYHRAFGLNFGKLVQSNLALTEPLARNSSVIYYLGNKNLYSKYSLKLSSFIEVKMDTNQL